MTGRIADEVYDGVRCAVCEQPFTPHEMNPFTGMRTFRDDVGHYVHTVCWDADPRMWRSLVLVVAVDVDNGTATVEIPGWHSGEAVRIRLDGVPGNVRDRFAPDFRCHARVNIGAETAGELVFADWEER